eukprot:TRINITY_DN4623_c0_g1_i1.p1 TRINITY_DN4623_c0_g1~~TRINITY_DN4623_c0_g1_i1.p1  ORF type:complete len:965 (+),score=237.77 TRINITY_DN4623_c0_g1_i1:83-2977(+)
MFCGKWAKHFILLLWKNWLLIKRSPRSILLQLATPFLFILFLFVIQKVVSSSRNGDLYSVISSYDPEEIPNIHPCITYYKDYCYDFVYSPAGDPVVEYLVSQVRQKNNPPIPASAVRGFANLSEANDFIFNNYNVTPGVYTFYIAYPPNFDFSTLNLQQGNFTLLPNATTYSPAGYLNSTNTTSLNSTSFDFNSTEDFLNDKVSISWEISVNRTTAEYTHSKQTEYPLYIQVPLYYAMQRELYKFFYNMTVNISMVRYPHEELMVYNIIASGGPFFFFGAIMFNVVVAVMQIVSEKEARLRIFTKLMGLSDSAFWLSWFVTHFFFYTLTVLQLILWGYVFDFPFFTKNNFGTYFFLFFLFAMSLIPVGFLISTILKRVRNAIMVGFLVFVIGFAFIIAANLVYDEDTRPLQILSLFAPCVFAKGVGDLNLYSATDASSGLALKDAWDYTDNTPLGAVYIWLIADGILYLLLALYFDNVVPNEYGTRRELYFFVLPSYWIPSLRFRKKNRKMASINEDVDIPHKYAVTKDNDVVEEENRVKQGINSENSAVEIRGLVKKFGDSRKGGFFRCCHCLACGCCPRPLCGAKIGAYKAVDQLYLSMRSNQVFCLLGPNGAGKTTTISMLVGLLPPTSGDAVIEGKSITESRDEIQKEIGICPQFDVLWDQLTGMEHLIFFAGIKGVPLTQLKREAKERLEEVSLWKARNKNSAGYSGGMKRRLSVAVALIGNPRVVFLDEPTTGMDPVSRREVWNIIEKAKKNRLVLLTTHSMEEADILGDQIAIMAKGKLKCLGTSLHLKNKFGAGYTVTVGSRNLTKTIEFFKENLKTVQIEAEPIGNFVGLKIGREENLKLPAFFEQLEEERESLGVFDLQISLTTLEEVFLSIAEKAEREERKARGEEALDELDKVGEEEEESSGEGEKESPVEEEEESEEEEEKLNRKGKEKEDAGKSGSDEGTEEEEEESDDA